MEYPRIKFSYKFIFALAILALIILIALFIIDTKKVVRAQNQIKIFPTAYTIESSNGITWQNPQNAFNQDLSDKASFIDFNEENSTFIQGNIEEETTTTTIPEESTTTTTTILEETTTTTESTTTTTIESTTTTTTLPLEETTTTTTTTEPPPTTTTTTEPISFFKKIFGFLFPKVNAEGDNPVINSFASIIFNNFSLSEEFDLTQIQNVQLRFSLAGKGQEGDKIKLTYFYQNQWQNLGELNLSPEISNNINGGYFLYALPIFENPQDLQNLKIKFQVSRLRRQVGSKSQEVYLDSVWLELDYGENIKKKSLLNKHDWKTNEEPEFDFSFPSENNKFLSFFKSLIGKGEIDAFLLTPDNLETQEGIIIQGNKIKIAKLKKFGFRPGLYKLKIKQGDQISIQEFTWGVLAINTNKSIFLPNETAYLQMAVLKDDGHTICDASLKLEITNPKSQTTILSTTDGTIKYSGKCGPNNVTDVPDYFAYYQVGEPGNYEIKLTNLDSSYEILDSFEVRDSVPFEIERIGPTRIYPPATYEMKLKIKANQDFNGEIIEIVPAGFEISIQNTEYRIQNTGQDQKSIVWEVDWKIGKEYELSYTFDVPDISPYIYLLGPLKISNFQEIRQWQIASDLIGGSYVQVEACTTECTTDQTTPQQAATLAVDTTGKGTTDWLVIVNWEFHTTNLTPLTEVTVQLDNTTTYTTVQKDFATTTDASEYANEGTFFMMDDLSASSHAIDVDFRQVTSGGSAKIRNIHIVALRLDNIFSAGDYVYAENSATFNLSTSFQSVLSTSITPGSTGKYLFLMSVEGTSANAADDLEVYLDINGTTAPSVSNTDDYLGSEPINVSNVDSHLHGRILSISSLTTFQIFASTPNGTASAFVRNRRLFAMRLDTFGLENAGFFYAENQTSLAEDVSSPSTRTTLTFTPPQKADYLMMAFGANGVNLATAYAWQDLNWSTGSSVMQQGGHDMKQIGTTNQDYVPFSYAEIFSDIETEQTFEHRHWWVAGSAGNTSEVKGSTILAVRLNFNNPPNAPTLHDIPFDNEKTGDSTPDFEFTASDPDGTAGITYQIQIDDNYNFGSLVVDCESDSACATGGGSFTNTENGGDSDPFTEGQRIRFTPSTTLSNNTTYYWRVRAKDVSGEGGSGGYGAWTTTRSFTVVTGIDPSEWFQTTDEQFNIDTLINTETTGSGGVKITTDPRPYVKVQRGEINFVSGDSYKDIDITAVSSTTKAFILVWGTMGNANFGQTRFTAKFVDSDTIRIERNETGTVAKAAWQIIEADDNAPTPAFTVQTGEKAFGISDSDLTEAIDDIGDTSKAILIIQTRTTGNVPNESLFRGSFSSSTEIRLRRAVSGTVSVDVRWWVVKWHSDVTVYKGSTVVSSSDPTNASIGGTIDLTRSAIFMSWDANTNGLAQTHPRGYLSSTTQISFDRTTTTGTCNVEWAVVQFPSSVSVQSDNNVSSPSLGTTGTTVDQSINTVTSTNTFSLHTNKTTGTGTAWVRGETINYLISTENIRFEKLYEAQTTTWTYYVIDTSGWTFSLQSGTIMSPEIDFDWVPGATNWYQFDWSENEAYGTVKAQLWYDTTPETCDACNAVIPNSALSDNEEWFTTGARTISGLDTDIYNCICIKAQLDDVDGTPYLLDWTVTWEFVAIGTPVVSNVKLNNQTNIDLMENTTTSTSATAHISDSSGCNTITNVLAKIYRSGATSTKDCIVNENNCYSVASCTQNTCSGTDATYTCTIDMQFDADPTDANTPWTLEYWRAYIEATDGSLTGSGYSPADAPDINSLLALSVTGSINYGNLNPGEKNDPLDKITTVTATGNVSLDVTLYGTNMCTDYPTCAAHTMAVGKQKYALSTSTAYSSGTNLLVDPGAEAELNCPKTIDSSNKQTKDIWWGIEIPTPQASGSYTGSNTFIGKTNETPWP